MIGTINGAATAETIGDITCFTSDIQHLRIEDTDAYGIMYNGNYIKHYSRTLERQGYHDPIVGVSSMRFSGSPSLGEAYVIRGTTSSSTMRQKGKSRMSWDLTLESAAGADEGGNNKEYNSVQGVLLGNFSMENDFEDDCVDDVPFDKDTTTERLHTHEYTVFKDEFEHGNSLPLSTILNYFERPRSQSLGGSNGLVGLQEMGILAVVTRIDNLRRFDVAVSPGDVVTIHSYANLRRKSIVAYTQIAFCNGKRLARGDITVMSIDQESKRPRPLPEWALREVFLYAD